MASAVCDVSAGEAFRTVAPRASSGSCGRRERDAWEEPPLLEAPWLAPIGGSLFMEAAEPEREDPMLLARPRGVEVLEGCVTSRPLCRLSNLAEPGCPSADGPRLPDGVTPTPCLAELEGDAAAAAAADAGGLACNMPPSGNDLCDSVTEPPSDALPILFILGLSRRLPWEPRGDAELCGRPGLSAGGIKSGLPTGLLTSGEELTPWYDRMLPDLRDDADFCIEPPDGGRLAEPAPLGRFCRLLDRLTWPSGSCLDKEPDDPRTRQDEAAESAPAALPPFGEESCEPLMLAVLPSSISEREPKPPPSWASFSASCILSVAISLANLQSKRAGHS